MIYIATYVALLVLCLCLSKQPKLRAQTYPLVMAALFVFTAFRLEVGCDWNGYYRHFLLQLDLGFADALQQREPLWWALVQIVGQLGLSYPWLNVAVAAIFFAGVHSLARQEPDQLGFVVLLFPILIINMPMSGIRQAAAIGVMCIAFAGFHRRGSLGFAALTLIAAGFHSSAGVFVLIAPLAGTRWPRARLIATLLLAAPALYVLARSDGADLAIARYVNSGVDAHGALYRTGLLATSALLFFTILRTPWQARFQSNNRLIVISALMMFATLPMIAFSSVIADRLGYYLVPLQTVIFARIPFLDLGITGRFLAIAPYLGLLTVLSVWAVRSTHFNYCYLPYETWLFEMPGFYRVQN